MIGINGKVSCMEEYINQIEKYLSGQMSRQEETTFIASLASNGCFRSFALIVVIVLRQKKTILKFGTFVFNL